MVGNGQEATGTVGMDVCTHAETLAEVPNPVIPVILSGGAGTRLWPLSRTSHPKQFQRLARGGETLLGAAVRNNAGSTFRPPLVISHADHRFLVAEELRKHGLEDGRIILEPEGRNTAPAAVIAALVATRTCEDALILVAPSDHRIGDPAGYRAAVTAGIKAAAAGALVTFGVVPTRPETGYGYLKLAGPAYGPGVFALDRFVEKPNKETAALFLADGRYLWNSGIFLFHAGRLLREAARYAPDLLAGCQAAIDRARDDGPFLWLDPGAFRDVPAGAIDTVIMERTDHGAVVPLRVDWSDVGSWHSLWETADRDEAGNAAEGDVVLKDVSGSFIWASDMLVAALGIENLVVVATADAVLVCPRDRSQDVKLLVESLRKQGREESMNHVLVRRPWGSYEALGRGDRFQVKRLMVSPGKRLSIQMHHHRSEHWVVVRGTARILNGDRETLLFENQSTYIAAGTRHRLENPGLIPLELIEVQSGSYLGEDDIVRFEDDFGRIA